MFFFQATPSGYTAVLWSVGVGAAVVPVASRRGSHFVASVVAIDVIKNSGLLAAGCPGGAFIHREHATPSRINSQIIL